MMWLGDPKYNNEREKKELKKKKKEMALKSNNIV